MFTRTENITIDGTPYVKLRDVSWVRSDSRGEWSNTPRSLYGPASMTPDKLSGYFSNSLAIALLRADHGPSVLCFLYERFKRAHPAEFLPVMVGSSNVRSLAALPD